jgi:hypothetical protein
MNQQLLTAIQRSISELHSYFSGSSCDSVTIQTDGDVVSVFTSPIWNGVTEFQRMGLNKKIKCAPIYQDVQDSLKNQLEILETNTQYFAILEKAKSVGLTDDEIKILQEGNN